MHLLNKAELRPGFETRIPFSPRSVSDYDRFLRLEAQTGESAPGGLLLPVETGSLDSAEAYSLPGAPIAGIKGRAASFRRHFERHEACK